MALIPLACIAGFLVVAFLPERSDRVAAIADAALAVVFVVVVTVLVFSEFSDTSYGTTNWEQVPAIHPYYVGIVAIELGAAAVFASAAFGRIALWLVRVLSVATAGFNVLALGFLALSLSN